LKPGEIAELEVELWPTSIVVPAGYRIGLTVRGRDYEHPVSGGRLSNFKNELRGCGPFLHDDPRDRPPAVFAGRNTLHLGPEHACSVLLPVIPGP
jgi:predicted acyl esterase